MAFLIFNYHMWAAVNPNEVIQAHHQKSFSFNVLVGILGDPLIGPYFLSQRLNGGQYLHFLQNYLPNLLEDVSLSSSDAVYA